jgi:hypothetical protein
VLDDPLKDLEAIKAGHLDVEEQHGWRADAAVWGRATAPEEFDGLVAVVGESKSEIGACLIKGALDEEPIVLVVFGDQYSGFSRHSFPEVPYEPLKKQYCPVADSECKGVNTP